MDVPHNYNARRQVPNGHVNSKAEARRSLEPMSRAEKFEDEKRRIMSTCFAKTDEQGQLLQSYITHIRVVEDAMYPSQPPPPDADPDYKKGRVIIIAVKNSGRVWMHKARENDDLSFQIGKSWPMEDLQSIESFSIQLPRTPEDMQRAQRAGNVGFVLVITKPYYWQAKTAKEKDFFLSSLVKIYRKYTSGNVPQLLGFDQLEKDEMLQTGLTSSDRRTPAQETHSQPPPRPEPKPSPFHQQDQRPPPTRQRIPGEMPYDQSRRSPSAGSSGRQGPPSPLRHRPPLPSAERARTPHLSNHDPPPQPTYRGRSGTPQLRNKPSQESNLRTVPSQEQLRPNRFHSPPVPSPKVMTPQSSYSNLSTPAHLQDTRGDGRGFPFRNETEPGRGTPDLSASLPTKNSQPESFRHSPGPSDRAPLSPAVLDRWKPNDQPSRPSLNHTAASPEPTPLRPNKTAPTSQSSHVSNGGQQPPERRRPPLEDSTFAGTQSSWREDPDVPRPLGTKSLKADERRPPTRGDTPSKLDAKMPGAFSPPVSTPPPSFREDESEVTTRPSAPSEPANKTPPPSLTNKSYSPATSSPPPESSRTGTPDSLDFSRKESLEKPHRPGLGPMTGRKISSENANRWRKATTAATAFKPRAGGAGARLLAEKAKVSNEPDGITSVVPAPSAARTQSEEKIQLYTSELMEKERPATPASPTVLQETPQLNVSVASPTVVFEEPPHLDDGRRSAKNGIPTAKTHSRPDSLQPTLSADALTKRRRSEQYNKYLSSLDIDPLSFDNKGLDYEMILADFSWSDNVLDVKIMDRLESDLKREVGKLEAGSWLGHDDQKDNRVEDFENILDKAIAECDEMEGLLTLYGVELGTLNEDIAYIEAQSQGLQVQTANQKLLHTELQNLVQTVSINPSQIAPLKTASLNDSAGLEAIESSLVLLYKALNTVDPQALKGGSASSGTTGDITGMRALQDRKGFYLNEAFSFLDRTRQYLDPAFGAAFVKTTEAISRNSSSTRGTKSLDVSNHDLARSALWQFSPLMLFAKELDTKSWHSMMKIYQGRAKPVYQDEFRDSIQVWKKTARKNGAEDLDHLFTSQEKESEGLTSTARKLTVKRSTTLARGFRSGSNEKRAGLDRSQDGKLLPCDSFGGALDEMVPLICCEQNFIVDFFHTSSQGNLDFVDTVLAVPPEDRRGTNTFAKKPYEPDQDTKELVNSVMDNIFGFWPREMQNLVEWAISSNALQALGILTSLERKKVEIDATDQEFLSEHMHRLQARLGNLFIKFVDEQVRAIDDTKVKIKKRKGVIAFIRVFPVFSAVIENMLPPADGPEKLLVRNLVDDAYTRINAAMFDSLKVIAKEGPPTVSTGHGAASSGSADPDDKEALNYHILLIENMHHYLFETEDRNDPVLLHWRARAAQEMAEHQALYVNAVIRRPLGKLLDFVESTETVMLAARSHPAAIPNSHPSHSRHVFKKVLGNYGAKDVRKGIEALKARVEKHFGEADEPGLSARLVGVVLEDCERRYGDVLERTKRIAAEVYEGSVEVEFGKGDVSQGFRR